MVHHVLPDAVAAAGRRISSAARRQIMTDAVKEELTQRREGAKTQRNCAKRMECVQLAGAVARAGWSKSGSKLHALHTLRAKGGRQKCSQRARKLDHCVNLFFPK